MRRARARSRPKGTWDIHQGDEVADVTLDQINAALDRILEEPNSRHHTFSGGPPGETVKETVEILANGGRRITAHWPDWSDEDERNARR